MRRVFTILCVMLLTVSCLFCGCGKKEKENEGNNTETTEAVEATEAEPSVSQYVGTWKAVRGEFKGEETPVEDILEQDFVLTLREDGTTTVSSEEGEQEAKWTETSDGVKVEGNDVKMTFKNENGQLVFELFGFHLYLERQ